jgi:hypothetical protein
VSYEFIRKLFFGEFMDASKIAKLSDRRPFGVNVIIFMFIIYIIFYLLAILYAEKVPLSILNIDIKIPEFKRFAAIFMIIIMAALAVGFWRMQRWAWVYGMILVGLSMASDLWGYFQGNHYWTSMIINILIVFYLNQRDVQRAFSRIEEPEATAWTI